MDLAFRIDSFTGIACESTLKGFSKTRLKFAFYQSSLKFVGVQLLLNTQMRGVQRHCIIYA